MDFLKKLREEEPSSVVAYHLEGLLEAHDNVRSLLEKLGAGSASAESWAETLAYLQLEIYTHLAYHMKELRRPLKRLVDAAHRELPDLGEDEGIEEATKLTRLDS